MAAITYRGPLGRNLTPNEVDANFQALNDENAAQQTTLNSRAPIASPAFTGTPTAPTPAVDDATQKLATTAFVIGQASDALPLDNAAEASAGVSPKFARADHVHVGGTGSGSVQNALTPASTTAAPSVDAVVAGLALKADTTALTAQIDALTSTVNAQLASKFDTSDLSDQAIAEAGNDNSTLLTPLRAQQLVAARLPLVVGATTEVMAFSQWLMVLANGVGFTSLSTVGCSLTAIDSSNTTAVAASPSDGNFKRCIYRAQASGLNRAAGAITGNGVLRITGAAAETTIVLGFADANFADGSIFAGLYEGSATPAWTTTNPSAITSCAFIGAGCDETDDEWYVMWRGNTGSVTKVGTGIPRTRHSPIMVHIRPNGDGTTTSSVVVRVTRLSVNTGLQPTGVGTTEFTHTITTNIYAAGTSWGRVWVRSSLSGINQDSATGFQSDMLFGSCFGGRVPMLNYQSVETEPVPTNRTVTGAVNFVGADIGAIVNFNSASTAVLTLPTDSTLGFTSVRGAITVFIKAAGVPTIAPVSGAVTITGTPPTGLGAGKFIVLMPTGEANSWAYA